MIAKTYTCSLLGIDAILLEVEVDLVSGLPGFSTAGLPAVNQSNPKITYAGTYGGGSASDDSRQRERWTERIHSSGDLA